MQQNITPLDAALMKQIDAYWRAANYLSVGQIYLYDNPLLKSPPAGAHQAHACWALGNDAGPEFHICPLEPCHPARRPGHDFHRSRPRRSRCSSRTSTWKAPTAKFIPSHPGRGRMTRLFRQFSFPGGIRATLLRRHPAPIHEGGELGMRCPMRYRSRF